MGTHASERDGENVTFVDCPVCGWAGDVYYNRRLPVYCSNACKQKAYRERRRQAKNVTKEENASVTNLPQAKIERELDAALHLLTCDCKRGIWTVKGNVQIGGLRCDLCGGLFK